MRLMNIILTDEEVDQVTDDDLEELIDLINDTIAEWKTSRGVN